jgi:hypothetical protein
MSDYNEVQGLILDAMRKAHEGDLAGAEEIARSVRVKWKLSEIPGLTVDLMVLEGICGIHSGRESYASDRITRALAIAKYSGSIASIYTASAWMAYLAITRGDMRLASKFIVDGCARIAVPVAVISEFRCVVNLAVLFEYFGASTVAAGWFEYSRRLAKRCASPGLLSSVIYNMVVVRVNSAILARVGADPSFKDPGLDLLLVKSAHNFDDMFNVHVLDPYHKLVEAQARYLCGDFSKALELIVSFLGEADRVQDRFRIRGRFDCLQYQVSLGIAIDRESLEQLRGLLAVFESADELAIVKKILATGFMKIGDSESANQLLAEVGEDFRKHQLLCASSLKDLESAGLFDFPR